LPRHAFIPSWAVQIKSEGGQFPTLVGTVAQRTGHDRETNKVEE
jgi:hypothetical protein